MPYTIQQIQERNEALAWIRSLVEALISQFDIAYPNPNLCKVLKNIGGELLIVPREFDNAYEGSCKKTSDGGFVIRYSYWKDTQECNRKNLEIAKWLGYLIIFKGLLINEKQWNAVEPEKWMGNTVSLSLDQHDYLNYFASQLIMPERLLVKEIDENMIDDTYFDGEEVARHFNAPISFVSIRAQELHH